MNQTDLRELLKEERELHDSYDDWVADHEQREGNGLSALPYDTARFPEQSILNPRVDARDASPATPDYLYYLAFRYKLAKSLGWTATNQLVSQYREQLTSSDIDTPLLKSLREARELGQNTAIVSPHFKLTELAFLKGLRFLAQKDRSYIDKSGTILNLPLTREAYRGKPVVSHFVPLGHVYKSAAKTESAIKYDVPLRPSRRINLAMLNQLIKKDMAEGGMEIDYAPSGSEMKPITSDGEIIGYEMPYIDIGAAELMTRFDNILVNALVPNANGKLQLYIGDLLNVPDLLKQKTKHEIIYQVVGEMTSAVEEITGKAVNLRGIGALALKASDED